MTALRVPQAKFKCDMAPFILEARAGRRVIVTNHGQDEFVVVPCAPAEAPPGMSVPLPAKAYHGLNLDEPAFTSWEGA